MGTLTQNMLPRPEPERRPISWPSSRPRRSTMARPGRRRGHRHGLAQAAELEDLALQALGYAWAWSCTSMRS